MPFERQSYTQRVSAASRRAAAAAAEKREPAAESTTEPATPSGRLLLRMPRTLHGELAEAAEREGTSLNQFITGTLASAIGWNGDERLKEAPHAASAQSESAQSQSAQPGSPQSRRLFILLLANAIVVGIAGVAAIGILLLAWLG